LAAPGTEGSERDPTIEHVGWAAVVDDLALWVTRAATSLV
jgi:hypothetical protein